MKKNMKSGLAIAGLLLVLSMATGIAYEQYDRVTVPQYVDVGNGKLMSTGHWTVCTKSDIGQVVGFDTATKCVMVYTGTSEYHLGQTWYRLQQEDSRG